MTRLALAIAALVLLASCPRVDQSPVAVAAPDLETAAVLRGLVRDPADVEVAGLYARDTDRLCVVRSGSTYRVGAYVDYGDGIGCNGAGAMTASGGRLRLTLREGCTFAARFDGDRIVFPAVMPDACARLCGRRASFAAMDVTRLSESAAEAATMRDARGHQPCSTS